MYECVGKRCRSLERFAADHVCYRLDKKGAGEVQKQTGQRPRRVIVGVASDQGVVDADGQTVVLSGLALAPPTPLCIGHRSEERLGDVTAWIASAGDDGAPVLFFGGEVGYGEKEDAAWSAILAGRLNGCSVGLTAVRAEGAVVVSAVLREISLGAEVKCPTALLLLAQEGDVDKNAIAAAAKGWRAWRAKWLEAKPRAVTRPVVELVGQTSGVEYLRAEAQKRADQEMAARWDAAVAAHGWRV